MPELKEDMQEGFYGHHRHHHHPHGYGQIVVGRIFGMIIFALIFGYAVQLLWNWLMPGLFNLKQIGYWEGFGIVILTRILFGTILPHPFVHDDQVAKMHFKRFARDDNFWHGRDRMNKWKFYGEYWNSEGRDAFKKYVEKHEQEMKDGGPGASTGGTGTEEKFSEK
ncbi:MAG: hypothetical protein ABSG94_11735 [Brevinematales bacterium]|jgi:hypothetical protein